MNKWRPEGWNGMVESPYMHDGVKMAKEDPGKALELELEHQAFRKGQEAGADAMLEAIRNEIEKGLMSDEELEKLLGEDFRTAYSGHIAEYQDVAQAQVQKILSLLKE